MSASFIAWARSGTGPCGKTSRPGGRSVRRRADPNAPVDEHKEFSKDLDARTVIALKDVSLEQRQGEVIGIVGSNGAGKSTLLKLIAGLTAPTTGRILVRGRVGSLLEVGTGFHGELTGRENVFLKGAILGMKRVEVARKFDEIVAFAGLERFIDTPVKRYSSGMFMRLGFSVAAHLEPEIMLIDEALAVGDAHFQQKCLHKIRSASRRGQSVLFVSHNMDSVREICHKGIVISDGKVVWTGGAEEATEVHLKAQMAENGNGTSFSFHGPLSSTITYTEIEINGRKAPGDCVFSPETTIRISALGESFSSLSAYRTVVGIFRDGTRVVTLYDLQRPEPLPAGRFRSEVEIPAFLLRPGRYRVGVGGHDDTGTQSVWGSELASFTVMEVWSDNYQSAASGLVNLGHLGRRIVVDT